MPVVIHVPEREYLDDKKNEFVTVEAKTLTLEHSLLSISKWESRWHKSYLSEGPANAVEALDYIRCMTITPNVNPMVYSGLTEANLKKVRAYISNPMTATKFSNLDKTNRNRPNGKNVTNEEIYYWMIAAGIPFECEKWHINRLMTLIQVCNLKEQPAKRMRARDIRSQYQALNSARRARTGSRG